MINNSVKKCVICNNEKCGEFITINDKKYHLCCVEELQKRYEELEEHYNNMFECHCNRVQVEQLQNNWNELKKWLIQLQKFKGINQQGFSWGVAQEVLDKMQELEGNNE